MKKIGTLLILCLASLLMHAQTCTPTWPNGGGSGESPDSIMGLPSANAGVPYSTTVNFKVPLDTTYVYSGYKVAATVDSITIDSVLGLDSVPASPAFTYTPNPKSGVFNGGTVGCILVTGTALVSTAGHDYPLKIYVRAFATLGAPFNLPISIPYTISFYSIFVNYPTGIEQVNGNTFTLLSPSPNPAGYSTTLSYYMPQPGSVNLKVYSILGQLITDKSLNSQGGFNTYQLETDEMPTGQYFYTMTFGEAQQTRQLSVVK